MLTILALQPPSRSTKYHIVNCKSSHQTQVYCLTPTQLSLHNRIMSASIGGMVFFEQLIEDGKSIQIRATDDCKRMMMNYWTMRSSSPPRRSTIPNIMVFLSILLIIQAMKILQKKLQKGVKHRWELPGNYPVFTVVMVIYHYVERTG